MGGLIAVNEAKELGLTVINEAKEKGITVMNEAKEKGITAMNEATLKGKRTLREAVTGDPNTKVRVYMKKPRQVRFVDKVGWTMNVLLVVGSHTLLLVAPNMFPAFFTVLMSVLLSHRFVTYMREKQVLFMIDFCYVINISVAVQSLCFPTNLRWFQVNYVMTQGPLCVAILLWKNSLVFHGLDKITSLALHLLPAIVTHLQRWNLAENQLPFDSEEGRSLSWWSLLGDPILLAYLPWLCGFLIMLRVFRSYLRDTSVMYSVRWLVNEKKTPFVKNIRIAGQQLGLFAPNEDLNPNAPITLVVYCILQLLVVYSSIIPAGILYSGGVEMNSAYLFVMFTSSAYNGASYYIEVFSKRYNLKFDNESEEEEETDCGEGPESSS